MSFSKRKVKTDLFSRRSEQLISSKKKIEHEKKMMKEQFLKFFANQKKFRETEKDVFVQRKNKSEKSKKEKETKGEEN